MERVLFLKMTPLFHGFSLEELAAVDQKVVEESFLDGTPIYQAGEEGERLYLVYEGDIVLTKGDLPVVLGSVGPREPFGESVLFANTPRKETATAKGNVILLSLMAAEYQALVTQRPELLFALARLLAHRLSHLIDRVEATQSPAD